MALKTTGLIHDHHVERPVVLVIIYQPHYILPVDDVDVRRGVQCPDPFRLASQYRGHSQHLCVLPLVLFSRPGSLSYLLRCDHQDLPDKEAIILQLLDGRQCRDRLSETHIQEQPYLLHPDDLVDAVLLICVRLKYHPVRLPSGHISSGSGMLHPDIHSPRRTGSHPLVLSRLPPSGQVP